MSRRSARCARRSAGARPGRHSEFVSVAITLSSGNASAPSPSLAISTTCPSPTCAANPTSSEHPATRRVAPYAYSSGRSPSSVRSTTEIGCSAACSAVARRHRVTMAGPTASRRRARTDGGVAVATCEQLLHGVERDVDRQPTADVGSKALLRSVTVRHGDQGPISTRTGRDGVLVRCRSGDMGRAACTDAATVRHCRGASLTVGLRCGPDRSTGAASAHRVAREGSLAVVS